MITVEDGLDYKEEGVTTGSGYTVVDDDYWVDELGNYVVES